MSHGRVIARDAPAALIAEHAGRTATEYRGPPHRLCEVERVAQAGGMVTRRTGPSVSVLHAERVPPSLADRLGEGVDRPTNLEDVFVALTGEQAA